MDRAANGAAFPMCAIRCFVRKAHKAIAAFTVAPIARPLEQTKGFMLQTRYINVSIAHVSIPPFLRCSHETGYGCSPIAERHQ